MPDGEGGVAVGRVARIASRVAAFTAEVPVGGIGCTVRRDVAVGRDSGDGIDAVGLTRGEASGE